MKRKNLLLLTLVAVLTMFCLFLQFSPSMSILYRNLQVTHVPSELLSYNKLGEIFHQLHLIRIIPNHSERYKPETSAAETEEGGPFQKRRQVGVALIEAGREHPLMTAAKNNVAPEQRQEGQLYFSVVTEEENIDGPQGILTTFEGRGRNWEKLAYVAIYKGETLLTTTAVGLRLHGGTSRDPALPRHSYRIYFRKVYGLDELPTEEIFSTVDSVETVVIHAEYDFPEKWPLSNVIANALYRMAGVTTLDYEPAHFILNGIDYGLYWVCPHLSEKYLRRELGIRKMHYQRYRGEEVDEVYRQEVSGLAYDSGERLTAAKVGEVVDLENLVNYFIAVTYSGNTDWNQGIAYRDAEDDTSIWHWIAWDLDHSFIDQYRLRSAKPDRAVWEQEGLRELLLKKDRPGTAARRSLLIQRLLDEDPRFRSFFVDRYVHVLNHELGLSRLEELHHRYRRILEEHGSTVNPLLKDFFANRHSFIRKELEKAFALGSFEELRIDGSYEKEVFIDGFPERLPYLGHYPAGTVVTIRLPATESEAGFRIVDGEGRQRSEMELPINRSTRVLVEGP